MAELTPNIPLPYIDPAQAQKHVTVNQAIRALDAIVQLSVLDRNLTAPPGSPANGARYIVAASATGDWAGQDGKVAAFQDGAWAFYAPQEGWLVWVADEDIVLAHSGSAWISPGRFDTVGINATADATNRLSLTSPASLFNHAGTSHNLKINKNAVGDTASIIFQTNFSGRAEMGLVGSDEYVFKVSANGSTFFDAIKIDQTNGFVTLKPKAEISYQNALAYTLVLTDAAKIVERDNAAANTLTVPPNSAVAFPIGTRVEVVQTAAGQTTLVAGAGVTLRAAVGLKISAQYGVASLYKRGTNEWVCSGALVA